MPPLPAIRPQADLHVVGLVASAGGIEAMLQLFAQLQPNGHCTYVVAQHMGNRMHTELMTRVLRRTSVLPIVTAQPLQPLLPDTIYFIPAGYDGTVTAHGLQLVPPAPGQVSTPSGNTLLASMAKHCPRHCTGVILSGAGIDGMEGARAVHRAGGNVWVQDPTSAAFNGMPNATIEAKVAHQILPLDEMAALLHQFPPAAPVACTVSNAAQHTAANHAHVPTCRIPDDCMVS